MSNLTSINFWWGNYLQQITVVREKLLEQTNHKTLCHHIDPKTHMHHKWGVTKPNVNYKYVTCSKYLPQIHWLTSINFWREPLAQLLSLLWQMFLTEPFLQKLYFLSLEILTSKQMVQVSLFSFWLRILRKR